MLYSISTFRTKKLLTAFSTMHSWTEGVPHSISWPFLRRNFPGKHLTPEDDPSSQLLPKHNQDGLVVRIYPGNYNLAYDSGTTDWWVHDKKMQARGLRGYERAKEERSARFQEKFARNAKWMEGMSLDDVEGKKMEWRIFVKGEEELDLTGGKPVDGDCDAAMKD